MGNTRFRLAHVMPNVWFYKLRDIGRTRSQRKLLETRKTRVPESAIALPRRSYYFVRAEGGYALPQGLCCNSFSGASKHVLQYGSNNVAGLPSPVRDEDDQHLRQHFDQPLGKTVKEMFDLVHDPFTLDTSSITCSSSCSWSISNSLTPKEQSDEEISEEVPFFNAKSPEFFNAKNS